MISRDESLRLFGTTESVAETVELRAGRMRCEFDVGAVRRLWWDETEVLRGIAYLLRDRDWGTAPARISGLEINRQPDRFEIGFTLTMAVDAATLTANARIEGGDDGTFRFQVEASTDHDLSSSRCGFVLLHPAECAGLPLSVEHTDGQREKTEFPRLISPGQPVFDIRELAWSPSIGVTARCRLHADLPGRPNDKFEMEDQRNWTDASFKTYVGSLLDSWPYLIKAGVSLSQSVELQIADSRNIAQGASPANSRRGFQEGAEAEISFGPPLGVCLPPIGVGVPHLAAAPNAAEYQAVIELRPQWLVVQAELARDDLYAHLAATASLSAASGADVQLDVLCPPDLAPDACADRIVGACAAARLMPAAVRFCPVVYLKSYQPTATWPDVPPLEVYAQAARSAFPSARIGGGMVTNFTELNRKRQTSTGIDFIGHSSCPIIHAADDASVMETLSALPHVAATVRHVWPALGWRLGPSALPASRNPYGSTTTPNPLGRRLPLAANDPRHSAQFGAAWCAGYAAAVAPLGVELLALLDSHGARGPVLLDTQSGRSTGAFVPAWSVLRWLAKHSGASLLRIIDLPPGIAGLATREKSGASVDAMLVNLTDSPQSSAFKHPMFVEYMGRTNTAGKIALDAYDVLYLTGRTSDEK
jgi:hypothetical protein